jgi:hypothetical protein
MFKTIRKSYILIPQNVAFNLLRVAGLEPARYRYRGILSPLRLPIPPHPHMISSRTNENRE